MTDNLFEHAAADRIRREAPLARRVAPRTLDDIVGQDHILGPGKILRRAIEADRVTSLILYGPPGSGKTALARLIAMRTSSVFAPLNAVTAGVKDLRELIAAAHERRIHDSRKTIVFVDEIHRFNRAQQDALLPDVENGKITLVGATTEKKFNTKSRAAVGIDIGMEADASIKRGKTKKGELTIDSKFGSMCDGLQRFDGARCTALLVGLKDEVLTEQNLVFTGFIPSVELSAPEGDGEAMANAATGKFADHLFFVAP